MPFFYCGSAFTGSMPWTQILHQLAATIPQNARNPLLHFLTLIYQQVLNLPPLRESGVREETIADIIWHTRRGMTVHSSVAQIEELVEVLERITDERSRTNRSLEMIRREQVGKLSPHFVLTESKKANQRLA